MLSAPLKKAARQALCAALLLWAPAARALDYRVAPGRFEPTPQNLRLFWGGTIPRLEDRLRSAKLLSLASPRALQVLESAPSGQNLAFFEYPPAPYRRKPWLFLDLELRQQADIFNQSVDAASQGLAKKAPGILRKASRIAGQFRAAGLQAGLAKDFYSGTSFLEKNPAYLSEPVRAQLGAVWSEPPPPAPAWHPVLERSKPALDRVWYSKKITPEQRSILDESLRRRKSPWYDELKKIGVDFKSPFAPRLKVREARVGGASGGLSFLVEWEQGKTHVGAFHAVVSEKDAKPELSKAPAPPPPLKKQLTLRFRKTITKDGETKAVQDEAIALFLEKNKLRLVSKDWQGDYAVAVTGRESAGDAAYSISRQGMVLYAAPKAAAFPLSKQVRLVFQRSFKLPKSVQFPAEPPRPVSESKMAGVLNNTGMFPLPLPPLTVIEDGRDGSFVVGFEGNVPAQAVADALSLNGAVLFAAPVEAGAAQTDQLILTVKPKPLDENGQTLLWGERVKNIFRTKGLRVLEQVGPESFRAGARGKRWRWVSAGKLEPVAERGPRPEELAERLKKAPFVVSVVRVGSLPEERVEAAIKSLREESLRAGNENAIGGLSSGAFARANHEAREGLLRAGATEQQLKRFDEAESSALARGRFSNTED